MLPQEPFHRIFPAGVYDAGMPLPKIEPIIPILKKEPFDDSENGKEMSRFDRLAKECGAALDVEGAILDGEIVCLSELDGRPLFMELIRGEGQKYYAVFDLLWLNGEDLRALPLIERKKRLDALVPPERRIIRMAYFPERGKDLFQSVQDYDLEGIVAKKASEPYNAVHTRWYKIKSPTYTQAIDRADLFHPKQAQS